MSELKYPVQWKNSVKFSKGGKIEKLNHKITKSIICAVLSDNNLDYATEAELNCGGRADIYVLEWGISIEVLGSETKKMFSEKTYKAIPIRIDTPIKEISYMIDDLVATKGTGWRYYLRKFMGGK